MRAMMWAPNAGRSAGPVHHDALELHDHDCMIINMRLGTAACAGAAQPRALRHSARRS